jgi:23S rRNA (adenine2503-C2)-methyltransferase
MKKDIKDLTIKELERYLEKLGEKKFRAKQIFSWIYKGADSFEDMTNLSKDLRDKLSEDAALGKLEILIARYCRGLIIII